MTVGSPDMQTEPGVPASRRENWQDIVKPLLAFGVLAGALVLVYFSPLRQQLRHLHDLRQWLRSCGDWAPVLYMAGVFVLTAMGSPRLIFCPLGGMIFGFTYGLLWTQIATLSGYYVTFVFVRWGGRAYVLRRWPKLRHMHAILEKHAAWKIIVLRQVPITGAITNCYLAMSPIKHVEFLLGTAFGLLPQAIPATLVGSSAVKTSPAQQILFLGLALVVFAAVLMARHFARRAAWFDAPGDDDRQPGA